MSFHHLLRSVFVLLLVLQSPLLPKQGLAQSKLQATEITLHVRHLEDGRWIAWTEDRLQRNRVNVPQDREAIIAFAKQHGLKIEWLGDVVKVEAVSEKKTSTQNNPAPRSLSTVSVADASLAANETPAKSAGSPANGPRPASVETTSEAELVTKLELTIQASENRLAELKGVMSNPEGEYQKAQTEFKEINARLESQKLEVTRLRDSEQTEALKAAEMEVVALEKKWALSRERFNLAITSFKTQQEQVAALQEKIRQDRAALEKLFGQKQPMVTEAAAHSKDSVPSATTSTGGSLSIPGTTTAGVATAVPPSPVNPLASAAPAASGDANSSASSADKGTPDPQNPKEAGRETVKNAKLVLAEQQADLKKEEAREAELEAKSVSERLSSIDRNIEIEQKLLDVARKKSDNALQQRNALQEEYQAKLVDASARPELPALLKKLKQAEQLFHEARTEVSERIDHLKELQDERTELQAEEVAALTEANAKASEAAAAAGEVTKLTNPFSLHNMTQWAIDHGLKMGLIIVVVFVLRFLVKLGNRRIVRLMMHGGHGTADEREDRASTLMGVFHNAASVAITIGGGLMICEEAGVPVGTLMGGAAILGLAVAFGAQNLIRDYFYGFVILLENQYKINDVLKIGNVSGQVERITLRMTALRDLEGHVHFIPNGKIDSVTNMTHGWSRAVFEIAVAYKEDVDRLMGVLMELARDLKRDPKFAPLILDEPEMLGVDALGDSSVIIKFVMKTRPLRQWQVKREMLRRIKRTFDELRLEIPFPHRVNYHHVDSTSVKISSSPAEESEASIAA